MHGEKSPRHDVIIEFKDNYDELMHDEDYYNMATKNDPTEENIVYMDDNFRDVKHKHLTPTFDIVEVKGF